MRAVLAAVIIASLAAPALAQEHMPQYHEADKEKTPAQKAADKAAAQAYQRSLGAIPDKGPTDPWGDVRSTNAPKPAVTRTAKTKAKTKSSRAEPKPQ